jgi:hypothetical protein
MLVDRVVQDFKNTVVKAAFIGVTDVHSGTLSDGF